MTREENYAAKAPRSAADAKYLGFHISFSPYFVALPKSIKIIK